MFLSCNVSPRTWRVKPPQLNITRRRMITSSLAPRTITTTRATRMNGNAIVNSTKRWIISSMTPPNQPEIMPNTVPQIAPAERTIPATIREILAPCIMRVMTSRPSGSVPSRCAVDPSSYHAGGMRRSVSSPKVGSYPEMTLAKTAKTMMTLNNASGTRGHSLMKRRTVQRTPCRDAISLNLIFCAADISVDNAAGTPS